ncbi:MAG: hypothetical protein NWS63_03670 [Saprospiraceae bacterium]|jgi:hypothetical protein|nr:hypothetical protein [Saprospiraceae bacterium]MDP4997445.1 hypothetical protein [Saprospiraceae bacterium]
MVDLLLVVVVILFIAMLFLNIYFRVKVFGSYKRLVKQRVEFSASHVMDREKMRKEVYARYPQMQEEIETFVRHLRFSVRLAIVLIVLISLVGAVLMYFR